MAEFQCRGFIAVGAAEAIPEQDVSEWPAVEFRVVSDTEGAP